MNNYQIRQKNWIKANQIKVRDKVLVLGTYEYAFNTLRWDVGRIFPIISILKDGISLGSGLIYPYTMLTKVPNIGNHYARLITNLENRFHMVIINDIICAKDINDFGWQEDLGNGTPGLRKLVDTYVSNKELNWDNTYKTKGYYPCNYSDNLLDRTNFKNTIRTSFPLVVASTLTGIGLPIIKIPPRYLNVSYVNSIP